MNGILNNPFVSIQYYANNINTESNNTLHNVCGVICMPCKPFPAGGMDTNCIG